MPPNRYGWTHQQQRAAIAPEVAAGRAWCAEPVCLFEADGLGRLIEPGSAWDLCHDPSGLVVIGPGHARCNRSEAGRRRHAQPARAPRRWAL